MRNQTVSWLMTQWQTHGEPTKTKTELREMLAEATRNIQPEAKCLPKAKKARRQGNHICA